MASKRGSRSSAREWGNMPAVPFTPDAYTAGKSHCSSEAPSSQKSSKVVSMTKSGLQHQERCIKSRRHMIVHMIVHTSCQQNRTLQTASKRLFTPVDGAKCDHNHCVCYSMSCLQGIATQTDMSMVTCCVNCTGVAMATLTSPDAAQKAWRYSSM